MYGAFADPYCYPGTTVLENIPGLRDAAALERYELLLTDQRAREAMPMGRFSVRHYRSIHWHLFRDVYGLGRAISDDSDRQGAEHVLLS